jgi:predicted adenine nucleotide alpha hydrolase (AANH) superfamily ATPase
MQKLLLHICCGPCATHVIQILKQNFKVTGYFYNPNIYPNEEYEKRLTAARMVTEKQEIPFIIGEYDPQIFFTAVEGFEHEPENGERCKICYRLRLAGTAQKASEKSFDCSASTLTLGPQKRATIINPIGKEESQKAGIHFIEGDWKKKDGFKNSCLLSREYGIYRQSYCGCKFSMNSKAIQQFSSL